MIKEKIINNIKTIRESKNLTADYIAQQMGISQSTYSRKETGESDFSLTELIKLGDVLEVSVSRFIDLDLARIINNNQTNGNNGFVENYNNNSNDEGYKAALEQYKAENEYLRRQNDALLSAMMVEKNK
jgi:transcriptional regulator with XRE-family HTH domain